MLDILRETIWRTTLQSVKFLLFMQIIVISKTCGKGHNWIPLYEANSFRMKCAHSVKKPTVNEEEETVEWERVFCSERKSMSGLGPSIFSHLSKSMGPSKTCQFIFWFSQRSSIEQIMTYTGLKRKTVAKASNYLRKKITEHMIHISSSEKLGDRPGTIVCIDETFFTRLREYDDRSSV